MHLAFAQNLLAITENRVDVGKKRVMKNFWTVKLHRKVN